MIKIGIYDRYLSTAGGGERYSCKMAEILSKKDNFEVYLLTDLFADLKMISGRLNLDLSRVDLKIFPFISDEYTKRITKEYDIFINATYLSPLSAYGSRNIYMCYFPTAFDVDFRIIHKFLLIFFRAPALWLFKAADRMYKGFKNIEVLEGLYDIKRFFLRRGSWSSGRAIILLKDSGDFIKLGLKNPVDSKLNPMNCKIKISEAGTGKLLIEDNVALNSGEKKIVNFPVSKSYVNSNLVLEIISDIFIPNELEVRSKDSRKLGVVIYNKEPLNIVKKLILKILGFIPLFLVSFPRNLQFLETYNSIVAISKYTQYWIKKYWKKESTILFPPVDVENFKIGNKDKMILSVGRFFPDHHNKKQLELARIFIDLLARYPSEMKGYRLCLAGGVENKPGHLEYVESIRKITENHPIEILTNIEWNKLVELFSRSSIFWHAAGMNEDAERHPEKFEHFGITTVEAMASGCIPIVINKGGQPEIIENGVNGFLFETWDELKELTLNVCGEKIDAKKIRDNAVYSSKRFSSSNFEKELLKIIGEEIKKIT